MDGKAICQTMLYAYKDLDAKCKRLDEIIMKYALSSAHYGTQEIFDIINRLIDEKVAYCNVKVIIDEAVSKLGKKEQLVQHFILGKSIIEVCQTLNIREQQCAGRLWVQTKLLCEAILRGHRKDKLFNIINESIWLRDKYKTLLKDKRGKYERKRKEI